MADLKKVLFCNISWMKEYKGINRNDRPYSGAGYVLETGDAYEKYNFLPYEDGNQYGFIETKHVSGSTDFQNDYKKFNLSNFGEEFSNKATADGILVIFFARNPLDSKFYIVGYYKNASVYKERQFVHNNGIEEDIQYNLKCQSKDAILIPANQRIPLNLPRDVQLFYRQLFFYPDSSKVKDICEKIVENVSKYDKTREIGYLQFEHQVWLVPCNPLYFDIDRALTELPDGLWYGQNATNISAGDYVYLYLSAPVNAYRYKCIVLSANVKESDIDKNENTAYIKHPGALGVSIFYMRIKLVGRLDASLEDIKNNIPHISAAPINQTQLRLKEYLTFLETSVIEDEEKPSLADLDDKISDEDTYFGEISSTPRPPVERNGVRCYQRNDNVRRIALTHSSGRCAIQECKHELFTSRHGRPYLEAHHIIPINAQGCFPNINIDIPENVVCLCPSCHREIHNGEDAAKKVVELYELKKNELAKKGINIDIDDLLEFYK